MDKHIYDTSYKNTRLKTPHVIRTKIILKIVPCKKNMADHTRVLFHGKN